MPLGVSTKRGVGTWDARRGPRLRAGARRDVRRRREPTGGKDNQGWRSPSQHPRQPRTAPAGHRCYFQELFFDTELKRDSALPGASAERKVYIVEGFILARPGTCAGRAIARCPGGDAARSGGSGAVMWRLRGRDLSPGTQECLRCIAAGFTLVARRGGIKKEKRPLAPDAQWPNWAVVGPAGMVGAGTQRTAAPSAGEGWAGEVGNVCSEGVAKTSPKPRGKRTFHQLQKHLHAGDRRGRWGETPGIGHPPPLAPWDRGDRGWVMVTREAPGGFDTACGPCGGMFLVGPTQHQPLSQKISGFVTATLPVSPSTACTPHSHQAEEFHPSG